MITDAQPNRPESLLSLGFGGKLPIVLQTEASECGLACLAMVAGFHGLQTDLTTIRHRFAISAHGATLKQIMDIAAALDLSSRALKLDVNQLGQLQTPCILHWEMKHFVVLKKVSKEKVIICDPAIGERQLTLAEVGNLFTGVALELTPTPSFKPRQERQPLGLSSFWSRAVGLKRSLGLILVLSLMLQVFAVASPYYMQTVIDDVILRSDLNLLIVLALGFGLLLLLETGTSMLRQFVTLHLSSRLNIQMSANVFHHLIRLPMEYFSKRHMGDIVSRFGSLAHIREMLTNSLVAVFVDGLMAIITLTVMFVYSVKLALLVLAVVFLYGLFRYLFFRPLRRLNEERIVASAKENTHFMESVRAIQAIKLYGQESDRQGQWHNRLAESMNKDIQISRWEISFDTVNRLLFGLENILIIYFAAMSVTANLMTIGMLYAFMSYKSRFIEAMDHLIVKMIEFRMLDLHFNRLADIVFTEADEQVTTTADASTNNQAVTRSKTPSDALQVCQVSFSYSPIDPPVFSKLSFDVHPGETLAIVGSSGAGKSTLLKCMMGLYKVKEGEIKLGDQNIQQHGHYRSQIAAVMQDDQLFSGSIAENISCFEPQASIEHVVRCAHLAGVHDEIMATTMQYNTLVGDMGTNLSGGQKQRVVLARALYRSPSILFMDEATSHLDTTTEAEVNRNMKNLSITRIIVAHRPETIRSADRILRLSQGEIADVTEEMKSSTYIS